MRPSHLLVLRFSALGDIALCVPVFRALFKAHPELKITVVSRPFAQALFEEFEQVNFFPVDFKGKHKGIRGIWQLFKELKALPHQAVIDLHAVLRTHLLKLFYLTAAPRFIQLQKGRKEKKALTRKTKKVLRPLTHTVYRYAAVFQKLGYTCDPAEAPLPETPDLPVGLPETLQNSTKKWIGIAPFASHLGKMYPLDLMQQVVAYLQKEHQILLFGAGPKEEAQFSVWEKAYPNVTAASTKLSLKSQLALIAQLDLMLAMDSANGHFAANAGVPVLTLWGLTHPYLGFAPFGNAQNKNLMSDSNKFPLIPTSVYGNVLPEGYEEAFRTIAPKTVLETVLEMLETTKPSI
jgi:ADP-heptose:LPS heptosyltransferase